MYRLAHELGLTGWVRNCSGQVEIEASGDDAALDLFETRLISRHPPLAAPHIAQREAKLHVNLRATEQQGLLGQDDVDQLLERYPNASFYVCGPKPFEDAVRNFLAARDIGSERL